MENLDEVCSYVSSCPFLFRCECMQRTQTTRMLATKNITQPMAMITIVHVVQTTSPSSNSPFTKTEKKSVKMKSKMFFM